jgi:glycosyltransferase involved in cell wall biosynthesis
MPSVGVIMPTHGLNRYLAPAVESVLAQTFTDWTLVVVCDGAANETAELAESFASRDPRIRVLRQRSAGVAAARNRGLRELGRRVELVAFLDHDDRWLSGTLDTLARALPRADACVGVHGIARFIDDAGAVLRVGVLEADLRRRRGVQDGRLAEWPMDKPTSFANLVFGCCIPVGTVLVRRAVLDRVGGFDERAVPADDYDMWVRLSRFGDFAFVGDVVMEYRRHAVPTWVRPRGVARGVPYVRRKIITSTENTPEQAIQARQGYRFCEEVTLGHRLSETAKLARARRYGAAARQLVRAVLSAGGYAHGSPGPWHD